MYCAKCFCNQERSKCPRPLAHIREVKSRLVDLKVIGPTTSNKARIPLCALTFAAVAGVLG